ncbi:MAG: hypothetical protein CM15mP21_0960 [Hyphomicrobiales bacterium]|nr:MAG: hypothetical protein CM15mP21_0960 [Hyphomicrobiales bacterium]
MGQQMQDYPSAEAPETEGEGASSELPSFMQADPRHLRLKMLRKSQSRNLRQKLRRLPKKLMRGTSGVFCVSRNWRRGAKCRNALRSFLDRVLGTNRQPPKEKSHLATDPIEEESLWRIMIGSSRALRKRLRLPDAILMMRRHRINVRRQFSMRLKRYRLNRRQWWLRHRRRMNRRWTLIHLKHLLRRQKSKCRTAGTASFGEFCGADTDDCRASTFGSNADADRAEHECVLRGRPVGYSGFLA